MEGPWDLIREKLALPYDLGSWFLILNEHLCRDGNGRAFSAHEGGHPSVLVRELRGPAAPMYARSSTVPTTVEHHPHPRVGMHLSCGIDLKGWIAINVPLTVDREHLTKETFRCTEPEESPLYETLAK